MNAVHFLIDAGHDEMSRLQKLTKTCKKKYEDYAAYRKRGCEKFKLNE